MAFYFYLAGIVTGGVIVAAHMLDRRERTQRGAWRQERLDLNPAFRGRWS